jgi:hypothetical protein
MSSHPEAIESIARVSLFADSARAPHLKLSGFAADYAYTMRSALVHASPEGINWLVALATSRAVQKPERVRLYVLVVDPALAFSVIQVLSRVLTPVFRSTLVLPSIGTIDSDEWTRQVSDRLIIYRLIRRRGILVYKSIEAAG